MDNWTAPARRLGLRALLLLCLLPALLGSALAANTVTRKGKGWEYYLTGSAADRVLPAPRRAGAALMGGEADVDGAFRWLVQRAGGGDFVVIRASGDDGYQSYVFDTIGGVDSVETLVVATRDAANDPFVVDRVLRAEVLFIAGGDQSDYVKLWSGTALHDAIKALQRRNVPVGGISAGLAVMGALDFAALNGTLASSDALSDPYNKRVSLDSGFLTVSGLEADITDSHFAARDRMGRMLAFLARSIQDQRVSGFDAIRGVGVDAGVAVLLDGLQATLLTQPGYEGRGAYFLRPLMAPTVCAPKQPLTFRNVQVDKITASGNFNLSTWSGLSARYQVNAEAGVLTSEQAGGAVY
ncbi:cyanophycinase [Azohydromonas lata]|uniref:Cyanophycinase n=1 Tax=Azohydromonas lata TaxID=45677 RepID=A0ABU5IQ93_9BURK|nr:cyanophycinase [Azohydromonas lata]MDZ5461059.1 cyanophycinase [Azohydromonas lata]